MVKFKYDMNSEQLVNMLNSMLNRECTWQPITYESSKSNNEQIDGKQRDAIAKWLLQIHFKLCMNPESYALCLSIFDKFLLYVKAHPKYLKCIAISCLFLAIKCSEEDEVIPTTSDVMLAGNYACSVAEILRMERVILNKLQWNLHVVTTLDFVYVLYAILSIENKEVNYLLPNLIKKTMASIGNHKTLAFKPSTIAVAVISLELSRYTCNWLAATILLQKRTKLSNVEVIRCREVVSQIPWTIALCHGNSSTGWKGTKAFCKPSKRKAEQSEADEDIYDGIKRLYGDDGTSESKVASCSSQISIEAIHLSFTVVSAT